ncbi:uroporphyrinogen-III synthase [Lentibacillus lipolyticus]|nr:uroporphyrinogen-III synthase [Lentibacillus lipolyticus]
MSSRLYGKRILITREEKQAKIFSRKVIEQGGIPVEVPLLKISCRDGQEEMISYLQNEHFGWLFFTSVNGVHCFFRLLDHYNVDKRTFAGSNIAAVGHKTASALDEHGFQTNFIPSVYSAETMTREFRLSDAQTDEPILLIRGNKSRNTLPDWFKEQGIRFVPLEVYETGCNFAATDELNAQLEQNKLDFITFTSPSSVEAFMTMKKPECTTDAQIACIGTTTGDRAREFGLHNLLIPDEFTIDGMLDNISSYIKQKGSIDDDRDLGI